ncbi:lactonase family protein [Ilyomonas limi]|uniref:Lactonase family protein n=1 Tax=Ilyomonas limi TaxID=2575867 RepID=A0A4V5UWJ2_9BACT|nr:beta-propeller fold lactonase family protein [Ilyomonas limi]TKK71503.1 lactonase family protein [Ilyomonas limi]
MLSKNLLKVTAIAVAFTIASCNKDQLKTTAPIAQQTQSETSIKDMIAEHGANPDEMMLADAKTMLQEGYVYTESNEAAQNSIHIYKQHSDGTLSFVTSVASGGAGSGTGLGSQGALALDKQHQWLYAVNAGDNSVSSFWVHSDGSLTLAHTINSGGTTPVSLTVHGHWLYVVNSASANICGFTIGSGGTLTKIDGSLQPLSSSGAGPGEIKFHPSGTLLFVTEKATSKIAAFTIDAQGVAGPGTFNNSVGQTPYGFDFSQSNHYLVVSNAAGGIMNGGSCSSYATDNNGNINVIKGEVKDFQSAPCWLVTTHYGRFAFTTNAGSNSISSYYVSPYGGLYLVFFAKTTTGASPIDIVVSGNNGYVYNLNSQSHSITEYKRGLFGTLKPIGEMPGLPAAAAGLAAY